VTTSTALAEFEAQRPRLLGLAYRLLGEIHEAEDVVQDAYVRWSAADMALVRAPSAWLSKVVTNLSLNRLSSARSRRETYPGPWLPEPVFTSAGPLGPQETAEQRETISYALLRLMERLTPAERAVFVLREAFGYSHQEIAETLDLTETASRQLHHRARLHLADERRRGETDPGELRRLIERFMAAATEGDVHGLEELLAADVTAVSDGGGKVTAARRPVVGRDNVIRFVVGLARKGIPGLALAIDEVNGLPGLVVRSEGALVAVVLPEIAGGRIVGLYSVLNPDKLPPE
jgi:RNA polymerase sigma-70 factor (ECF subfamily)